MNTTTTIALEHPNNSDSFGNAFDSPESRSSKRRLACLMQSVVQHSSNLEGPTIEPATAMLRRTQRQCDLYAVYT
jgi:hypothetical protein